MNLACVSSPFTSMLRESWTERIQHWDQSWKQKALEEKFPVWPRGSHTKVVHNLSLEVYFCCTPSGERRKKRSDSPAVSKWISDGFGDLRQEGARDTMEKPFQCILYPAPLFSDMVRHYFCWGEPYSCIWKFQRVRTFNFSGSFQIPVEWCCRWQNQVLWLS